MKKTIAIALLLAVSTSQATVYDVGYTHDRGRVYADVQDKYTTVKYVRADGTTSKTNYEFNCGKGMYRKIGTSYWERFESHLSAAYLGYTATCLNKGVAMARVEAYPTAPEFHWRSTGRMQPDGSMKANAIAIGPSNRVVDIVTWDHSPTGTYGPDIDIIRQ